MSGACNKTADYLLQLVELPYNTQIPINMLSISNTEGPVFNARNQTSQCLSADSSTSQPDIMPDISKTLDPTPKSLTVDRLEALLQIQKTYPFLKEFPNTYQMEKHHNMK